MESKIRTCKGLYKVVSLSALLRNSSKTFLEERKALTHSWMYGPGLATAELRSVIKACVPKTLTLCERASAKQTNCGTVPLAMHGLAKFAYVRIPPTLSYPHVFNMNSTSRRFPG